MCKTWGQHVVFMLYDVICSRIFYVSHDLWLSLTLTLCSKNRKVRKQNENKNKIKKKLSPLFVNLTSISILWNQYAIDIYLNIISSSPFYNILGLWHNVM